MVNFTPPPLCSQGKIPGTRWIGSWMGSRAGLDAVVKRKVFPASAGNRTPELRSYYYYYYYYNNNNNNNNNLYLHLEAVTSSDWTRIRSCGPLKLHIIVEM
jgi:hypothetical protein